MRVKSSIEAEYCAALRARTNSGIPEVSNPERQAVHQHAVAIGGNDVVNDGPALAFEISGPVVVRDHGLAIFRVASGRNKGAAMLGHGRRRGLDGVLLVILRVVIAPLRGSVDAYDVPNVDGHPVRGGAIGDALQLVAVLLLDVRPHHVLGGIAEERPVLLVFVLRFEHDDLQRVFDFGGQQVTVLKSDLMRRALQMHIRPAVFLGQAERTLQLTRGLGSPRRSARDREKCRDQEQREQDSGSSVHATASWRKETNSNRGERPASH